MIEPIYLCHRKNPQNLLGGNQRIDPKTAALGVEMGYIKQGIYTFVINDVHETANGTQLEAERFVESSTEKPIWDQPGMRRG